MIFQPYSLSCTISSYPPSMGSNSPEITCFAFLF
jgi:hypothetical protein